MTLFEKIIAREIPAEILYEDERAVAIRDIAPQSPTHILIVPKKCIARISEASAEDEDLLGHLLVVAGQVAREAGISEDGYRLVINNGHHGCESVPHLHVHLLGGRQLTWPPG